MLLVLDKWGGIAPKIIDPTILPPNKSQMAENCRFDRGGIAPLFDDELVESLATTELVQSLFAYYVEGTRYFFVWPDDVDAANSPVPNDSYDRVYFTQDGELRVTDSEIFTGGLLQATIYPKGWLYPSPPAPEFVINAIPPQAVDPLDPGNLAVDPAGASASSEYDADTVASKAIDGDPNTYWRSDAGRLPAWWQYDLGAGVADAVNYVSIAYGTNIANRGIEDFQVLASNTGAFSGEETTLFEMSGLTWTKDLQTHTFSFINTTVYRYIRIQITRATVANRNLGPIRICEIELHATPGVIDETLKESRTYVYTLVNDYGSEGPPSDPSNIVEVKDGDAVQLFGMETAVPTGESIILDLTYDIVKKRIYRSNQTATGSAQFQLVEEIDIDTDTYSDYAYTDQKLNSALGAVLPSTEWDPAPDGIQGLIALPNGVLAGFVENLICFSVPFYPHAWPVAYQKAVDRKVVGLGSYGTTIVVLTDGQPYIIVGDNPANTVMEKVDLGLSCTSKKGIVHVGNVTIYPSPEGLVAITPNGIEILTKDLLTKEQWESSYNPSTIYGYWWGGKYVGFYEGSLSTALGFIFDLKTKDLIDVQFSPNFYPVAGYRDPSNEKLYLAYLMDVYSFCDSEDYRTGDYLSKRYKFPKTSFKVIKVLAESYPVTITVLYPKLAVLDEVSVASESPQRIPDRGLVDAVDISALATTQITTIYLASTMQEIPV